MQALQVVLHLPLARRGPLHGERAAHPGARSACATSRGRVALTVLGEHAPPVHPRQRRGAGRVEPDHVEEPGLRRAGRSRPQSSHGIARRSSSRTSTSARTRPATWWPTPSSSRWTTRRRTAPTWRATTRARGGVQLSSLFKRAAFALRLGDFNLLISSQITDKSRIMFVRDPVAMAQKAAPFLTFDHDPVRRRHQQRAHRLDRRRLHDDVQLRRTRRTPTPSRWRSGATCPAATTTCATRSRSSSTPTRGR